MEKGGIIAGPDDKCMVIRIKNRISQINNDIEVLNMKISIASKIVRGECIEVIEATSFFGGVEYQLLVNGHIKQQSADKDYILKEYDRYW
ncbi:hypothetical protein HO542_01015 [Streptococcus suis]|uniref:hypothetical protein n=2 Tax=Streptococcus suis TaxID=1307 RepID=UPI000CF58745|nr:hypothetical protein [Streptococcus suis]NQJ69948.1 hypothetical protein [Streptococcus suis]NQJ73301.1 hypothetical protein [Streptococcus suis]HEM5115132.1 hypothetical protein [Streptococcus suis]